MPFITLIFERLSPPVVALMITAFASYTRAEPPPDAQTTPVTQEPQAAPEVLKAPPVISPAPAELSCIPSCRSGFFCRAGTCFSLCNPPCAASESCTANGQCIVEPQAIPFMVAPHPLPMGEPPPVGAERHDGFMLRLAFGVGAAYTKGAAKDQEESDFADVSDVGWSFSVDMGGAPVENLIVHGRISRVAMVKPAISKDGNKSNTQDIATYSANFVGPAVTYYFMPVNMYVTGAIGLSRLSIRYKGDDESSDSAQGPGFNFDFGKEWWVSDNWGLGLAGRFWYTRITAGADPDRNFIAGAVLFSATYQ